MACYYGQPHRWHEIKALRDGAYVRLLCHGCWAKKWKKRP